MSRVWYYAVRTGHQVGVYTTWPDCERQVKGFSGAVYKKFSTREEATAWAVNKEYAARSTGPVAVPARVPAIPLKAAKTAAHAAGPSVERRVDVTVYADGSCLDNGKPIARAGVGVFFGDQDARNVSERLSPATYRQTNQVAEIMAALRAVSAVAPTQSVRVCTDSTYVVKAMNEWRVKWKAAGWTQNLTNRALLRQLSDTCDRRAAPTYFKYVKAHVGLYGNEQADALAKAAAVRDS